MDFNRSVIVTMPGHDVYDPFCVFQYSGELLTPDLRDYEFEAAIAAIADALEHNNDRVELSVEIVFLPQNAASEPPALLAERRMELIRQKLVERGVSVERIRSFTL